MRKSCTLRNIIVVDNPWYSINQNKLVEGLMGLTRTKDSLNYNLHGWAKKPSLLSLKEMVTFAIPCRHIKIIIIESIYYYVTNNYTLEQVKNFLMLFNYINSCDRYFESIICYLLQKFLGKHFYNKCQIHH